MSYSVESKCRETAITGLTEIAFTNSRNYFAVACRRKRKFITTQPLSHFLTFVSLSLALSPQSFIYTRKFFRANFWPPSKKEFLRATENGAGENDENSLCVRGKGTKNESNWLKLAKSYQRIKNH